MSPRLSSASWNVAEGALDQTIAILTQGESSARARALLVEARRLRSRIASWRAIPPSPATKKEAFETAMQLLRKAGEGPGSSPPPPPGVADRAPSRVSTLSREEPSDPPSPPPRSPMAARLPSSVPAAIPPTAKPPSLPPARAPSSPPASASIPPTSSAAPLPLRQEVVSPGVIVHRPRSAEWCLVPSLEGAQMKVVYRDEGLFRVLVRLAAGTEIPRHKHARAEDILIVDGTLVTDGVTMRAGEMCHAEAGSIHHASISPTGCTFLLIGAEKSELFWD